jgi:hypothetical protein
MEVRPVDPRDQQWERNRIAYRVYFWQRTNPRSPVSAWSSSEWEIDGADVDEVLSWARQQAAGRSFVLYACVTSGEGLGLIRLLGNDPLGDLWDGTGGSSALAEAQVPSNWRRYRPPPQRSTAKTMPSAVT